MNYFYKIKVEILNEPRADCDAPCFDQLKATHLKESPKQQALLDVLLQLKKTWPLTIWFFPLPTSSLLDSATEAFKFQNAELL